MSNIFSAGNRIESLAEICHLGAALHHSAAGSVYETEFGENARPGVIKVRRIDPADAGRAAPRWGNAIGLSHPNLLAVFAAGYSMMDDVPVSYVIMERADETLAEVLAERALSETETREMLIPVLAALKYLHGRGYAHSNLKPSSILAIGDLLKLSSDYVTPVSDGGMPAEDLRALGVVIVQALTREFPKIDEYSGTYILREASQTFTDIVRHCLDPDPEKRWTVDQVQAKLDAQAPRPLPPPARSARFRDEDRNENDSPPRASRWIYGVLAAMLLVVALVGITRKKHSVPPAVSSSPRVDQAASAASSPPAPTRSPKQKSHHPRPSLALTDTAKPAGPRVRGRRAEGWSVIVAAYISREPAEKRDRELSRKWPGYKWGVLHEQEAKPHYLVVIGQNLSEAEAEAIRKHAVASGLPRDTYIKKLL